MERTIFHIDVNSAFLSWEAVRQLKNGATQDLRSIPSAIAGDASNRRGIILAKSTPAKKFGITTGEPVGIALQKCPKLVCVPPDFPLYSQSSQMLFQLLSHYSDRLEEYSIDECFLEYTGMEQIFGAPLVAAQNIKEHIKKELGFTVNIGISSNKLLAKMAGELEKPDKIHTLYPSEIPEKLWPLPVSELFMVGPRTAPRLKKMGIRTIGDLANFSTSLLRTEFKSFGLLLHAYANGIESSTVTPSGTIHDVKSIENSTTIPFDVTDAETAHKILLALSETVSMRLRCNKFCAGEIAISIKSSDFKVYSHQKRLLNPVDCTNALYENAKIIFNEGWKGEPLRQLGIRAGQLSTDDFVQLSILDENWTKQKKADVAMDKLRLKYGKDTIIRSTFAGSDLKAFDGGKLKINNQILK